MTATACYFANERRTRGLVGESWKAPLLHNQPHRTGDMEMQHSGDGDTGGGGGAQAPAAPGTSRACRAREPRSPSRTWCRSGTLRRSRERESRRVFVDLPYEELEGATRFQRVQQGRRWRQLRTVFVARLFGIAVAVKQLYLAFVLSTPHLRLRLCLRLRLSRPLPLPLPAPAAGAARECAPAPPRAA